MSDIQTATWPLTAGQSGMWFAEHLDPSNPAYQIAECLEIHGPVNTALMETALRQVFAEAQILRLRFVRRAGRCARSSRRCASPCTWRTSAPGGPVGGGAGVDPGRPGVPGRPRTGPGLHDGALPGGSGALLPVPSGPTTSWRTASGSWSPGASPSSTPPWSRAVPSANRCRPSPHWWRRTPPTGPASSTTPADRRYWTERFADRPEAVESLAGRFAPAGHHLAAPHRRPRPRRRGAAARGRAQPAHQPARAGHRGRRALHPPPDRRAGPRPRPARDRPQQPDAAHHRIADAARSRLVGCIAGPEEVVDLTETQRALDKPRRRRRWPRTQRTGRWWTAACSDPAEAERRRSPGDQPGRPGRPSRRAGTGRAGGFCAHEGPGTPPADDVAAARHVAASVSCTR